MPAPDRPPLSSTAAGPARDLEMFDAGRAAARLEGDCWVPVPMPWRHVQAGDVFPGRGGLWRIVRSTGLPNGRWQLAVEARGSDAELYAGDPDELVPVLVPVPERDALNLARDQLGAQLIARRTA